MSLNVGELMVVLGMETGPFSKGVGLAVEGLNRFASAMADTAKKAIMAASDFNETTNVIEVGFGKGAKAAEMWAENTAKAVGRTTQQMREFASVSQAMLSSMVGSAEAAAPLSKGLAQLAVDLGSFWNVADKDAFGALRSAMAGEAEPMRRFGVIMTEANLNAFALANGVKVITENMTEGEKALLRYHFIMEKTKKEQGDAAKTADSFANQLKALGADADEASRKIGTNLIGEASKWLTLIRDIIKEMTKGTEKGFFTSLANDLSEAVRHGAEKVLNIAGVNVGENKVVSRDVNAAPFDLGAMVDADMAKKKRDADLASIKGKGAKGSGSGESFYDINSDMRLGQGVTALPNAGGAGGMAQFLNFASPIIEREQAAVDAAKARQVSEEIARINKQNEMSERHFLAAQKLHDEEMDRNARAFERAKAARSNGITSSALGGMNALMQGNVGGAAVAGMTGTITSMAGAAAGSAMQPFIGTIVSGIQEIFTKVQQAVQLFGETFAKPFMANDSRMGKAVGTGMAVGAVSAPFVVPAVLMSLAQETQSFKAYQGALTKGIDRVVKALEPAFEQLLPLAGLFIQLSSSAAILITNLIPGPPIAHALFEGFRNLATGLAWTMVGFINLRVAMTQYEAGIFKFLNEVTQGKDDRIKKLAGETGGDAQRALDERQALIDNAIFIHGMTEAGASALATSEALDKLTRSTTNMPSGYRVDVAAARAQDSNGTRPGDPTNGIAPGNYTGSVPGSGASGGSGGAGQQSQQQRAWDEMVSNLARAAANLANSKDYVSTGNARRPTRYAGRT